jgi:Fungal hydrophobin
MFSRFSSLLVYIVAGLVISAAATPMAPPKDYDDGSKAPSYPGSSYSSPKYSADKPYAKPYAEESCPMEKKYPEDKYPKDKYREDKYPEEKYPKEKYHEDKYPKEKYPEEKYPKDKYHEEKYPEDKYPKEKHPEEKDANMKQKYYPRGGPFPGPKPGLRKLNSRPQNSNNCNVGSQMCCNAVNRSEDKESEFQGILAGLGLMGDDGGDITQKIKSSDKFIAKNCSPDGTGDQCDASPMCCENNYFVGVYPTASFLTFSDNFTSSGWPIRRWLFEYQSSIPH